MPGLDVVVRAPRAVIGGREVPCTVGISRGVIVALDLHAAGRRSDFRGAVEHQLAEDEVLLPGLVDTHVHLQDPGHTEWEDFASGTRAAAAGGVTTVVDMPLDSQPATTTVAALHTKQRAARGRCQVDVAFWAGLTPRTLAEPTVLDELWGAGVLGFKCFLADTGLTDFPPLGTDDLEAAMRHTARLGSPLLVHAEDAGELACHAGAPTPRYEQFLSQHPESVEATAVRAVIAAARATGAAAHVVHVSSSAALELLAAARRDGVRVTAETCPHYLTFEAQSIPDGASEFAVAPPVRHRLDRDALWGGLVDGDLDLVVSDHSPTTTDAGATGLFGAGTGGVASLQLGLALVWTQASVRGISLATVTGWMATAPAQLAGLPRKGSLAVGADADLCVFAPDQTFTVRPESLWHKHQRTPYAGRQLRGLVRQTWLRGAPIDPDHPRGRLLRRPA